MAEQENFNWWGEETPSKKSPSPLKDVLPLDRPMLSGPKDRLVGEDDAGNKVYQTMTGQQYKIRPATIEETAQRQPLPVKAKQWWDDGAELPDFDKVVEVVKNLPEEAYNSIDRMISGEGSYGDVLGAVITMAAPGASKVLDTPDATLTRMFFGSDSPKANLSALEEAKALQDRGYSGEDIWLRTGWWEGPNGWKFEVSDEGFQFAPSLKQEFKATKPNSSFESVGYIKDQVIHKDFYESLPVSDKAKNLFANASLSVRKEDPGGAFYHTTGDITASAFDEDELKSITLHELQHYVQSLEGASSGGDNPSSIYKALQSTYENLPLEAKEYLATVKLYEMQLREFVEGKKKVPSRAENPEYDLFLPAKEDYDEAIERVLKDMEADDAFFETSLGRPLVEALQTLYEETGGFGGEFKIGSYGTVKRPVKEYQEDLAKTAYNLYLRNPGEIEARLTDTRKNLTASQRAIRYPGNDLDINDTELSRADLNKVLHTVLSEVDNYNNPKPKFAEGGMVENQIAAPTEQTETPPGALPKEVADNVDIKASEGEYIIPANVVRFIGLDKIEKMVSQANQKLEELAMNGRIGGDTSEDLPFSPDELVSVDEVQETPKMAQGGLVYSHKPYDEEIDPKTGLPIWMIPPTQPTSGESDREPHKPPTGLAGSVDQWTPKEFQTYATARNSVEQKAGQTLASMIPLGGVMARARQRYLERTVPKEMEKMLSSKKDLQGNDLDEKALSGLQTAYDRIKSEPMTKFGRAGLVTQIGRETGLIKRPQRTNTETKDQKSEKKDSFIDRLIDAATRTKTSSTSSETQQKKSSADRDQPSRTKEKKEKKK